MFILPRLCSYAYTLSMLSCSVATIQLVLSPYNNLRFVAIIPFICLLTEQVKAADKTKVTEKTSATAPVS